MALFFEKRRKSRMTSVQDILDAIDDFAPFQTAMEWDNSGLLAGSPRDRVRRTGVSLDVIDEGLAESRKRGCDCIVSHHPFLFSPIRRIRTDTGLGRRLKATLSGDISVIAAHTNWDVSPNGVNVILSELLKLQKTEPLTDSFHGTLQLWEGAVGVLSSSLSMDEFALYAKETLSLSWIRTYGKKSSVQKIALCGGSGGDYWEYALKAGADLFLTSDMKYHELQDAVDCGLPVALADHGEVERTSIPFLKSEIKKRIGIEVFVLESYFGSGKTFV